MASSAAGIGVYAVLPFMLVCIILFGAIVVAMFFFVVVIVVVYAVGICGVGVCACWRLCLLAWLYVFMLLT